LSIDPDGTPHPKQLTTIERPDGLAEFEQEVRARMPERHLLDILKNAEHWARFKRHFGPPSGSDPKSPRRRRCAGSTRSTLTPTSWKPRWST
jgi:hypothetical protein